MKIEEIQMKPFECHQSGVSCAHGCQRCWFFKERWEVELRGVKVKEGATLGRIYHRFQQLGPEPKCPDCNGTGDMDMSKPVDPSILDSGNMKCRTCNGTGQGPTVLSWIRKRQTDLMAKVDKGEDLDGEMVRLANLLTTLYNKAKAMAHLFWERYPTPSYLKTIGTEIKHLMTIQSGVFEGLVLGGTIDKFIEDTHMANFWIRDHKSTGMGTLDVIFAGFPWSTQARIYRILAVDYLIKTGQDSKWALEHVKGFILDGIMKPGIKLCGKDEKNSKVWNCSVEDAYLRRVKEWYAEKDTAAILSKSIVFNEPLYPPELVHELLFIQELGKRGNDPDLYDRDPSRFHCYLYDSQCIFYDLCSSPRTKWAELFDVKYKIKEDENENTEING